MDEGNRSRALSLLKEHVTTESLLKHAYAVEAAMRRMARHFHQDEEFWGVAGLLHDLIIRNIPKSIAGMWRRCFETRAMEMRSCALY